MIYKRIKGSRQIGNYLADHVPPNRKLFGGTVPPNRKLFGGTVPPNCLPHKKIKHAILSNHFLNCFHFFTPAIHKRACTP